MAHFSSEDKRLLENLSVLVPLVGAGPPEGKVVATVGRLYIDTDSTTLWIKGSASGSEGWELQ